MLFFFKLYYYLFIIAVHKGAMQELNTAHTLEKGLVP